MSQQQAETRTYRGRSLEELVPQIRSELGDDAVIVGRRETTSGGVGGFFARREIEVEVRVGATGSASAAQAFAAQLAQAQTDATAAPVRPSIAPEIDALPSATDVSVGDLFPRPAPPAAAGGLAALFNAGLPPAPDPAPDPDPAAYLPELAADPAPDPDPAAQEAIGVDQPTGAFDFLSPPALVPDPEAEEPETSAPEPDLAPQAVEPEPELFAQTPGRAEPEAAPGLVGLDGARAVADRLAGRGLRAELAAAVAEEAVMGLAPLDPVSDPQALVVDALARRIPVHPLRRGPGVVGFVGPGGSGKTRCVARLAAAYARHSALPITVITLRAPDEGAELTRLLAPYDVTLHVVDSGAEGAARAAAGRGEGLVIVDTHGVSPRNHAELRALAAELEPLGLDELHLTVPATIGPDAARELVGGVRELGVSALVVTHTDETEQLGTVIGLAIDSGVQLSYLARGQAVDMGLRPAAAAELAGDLLP